jgi:hypothetical protein
MIHACGPQQYEDFLRPLGFHPAEGRRAEKDTTAQVSGSTKGDSLDHNDHYDRNFPTNRADSTAGGALLRPTGCQLGLDFRITLAGDAITGQEIETYHVE